MNIDDLTVKDARTLANMFACGESGSTSLKVGCKYLIETATKFYLGELVSMTSQTIVLANSCWIADTGRFADFMKTGKPNEAEPVEALVHIPHTSINAAIEWAHALVKDQI